MLHSNSGVWFKAPAPSSLLSPPFTHQCLPANPTFCPLKLHNPISSILLDFPLAQKASNTSPPLLSSVFLTHTHAPLPCFEPPLCSLPPTLSACQELGTVKLISSGNVEADSLMGASGCTVALPLLAQGTGPSRTEQSLLVVPDTDRGDGHSLTTLPGSDALVVLWETGAVRGALKHTHALRGGMLQSMRSTPGSFCTLSS